MGAALHPAACRRRPTLSASGQDRWQVDETYQVAGQWRYVYRAIDQEGQVVDVFVSARRDATAARRFFDRAIATARIRPVEVVALASLAIASCNCAARAHPWATMT